MKENRDSLHHNDGPRQAGTGNASNPSLQEADEAGRSNQLLDEKAGTYIREAGNIEDMPDEKDIRDLDQKS